ncbi:MAG: type III-B CRISPR module RAMP protein Cmr4 [Verrucomicrobiales bacterium]|nr:type III-B CRISPR module RAMP protein Cmr4 [Verrucomicrobiales bacterium]
MKSHLLTLYTRTPLHVGCGTSVDVVDLPIMRERITNFPVIPSTSLKGVLRQAGRDYAKSDGSVGSAKYTLAVNDVLFGNKDDVQKDADGKEKFHAGCLQIMEAKLLAFPVRSLAGCFAWLTCPAALRRFQRDSGKTFTIPDVARDQAIVSNGSELVVQGQNMVVLEEYALNTGNEGHGDVVAGLKDLVADSLWSDKLAKRLAILHDEDFQHFVSTCTEVVARIAIDPATRTVGGGALFNQENVPCEALFYSVLTVLAPRRNDSAAAPDDSLTALFKANATLQIGGDETTGHGFCSVHHQTLNA